MHQPESSLAHDASARPGASPRRRVVVWVFEGVLALAFVGVVVYAVLFSVRVASGVTRDVGTPAQTVRLQIVNGCGVQGLAERVAERLNGYTAATYDVKVVTADDFNLRNVKKSFVISRIEDDQPARVLAARLGLEPTEVTYLPSSSGFDQATATLVLGEDYGRLKLPATAQKEK